MIPSCFDYLTCSCTWGRRQFWRWSRWLRFGNTMWHMLEGTRKCGMLCSAVQSVPVASALVWCAMNTHLQQNNTHYVHIHIHIQTLYWFVDKRCRDQWKPRQLVTSGYVVVQFMNELQFFPIIKLQYFSIAHFCLEQIECSKKRYTTFLANVDIKKVC